VIRNDTTLDAAVAAAQEALYEVYRH
jgi:hypothetical protein